MSESKATRTINQAFANGDTRQGYLSLGGLDMYYEVHGSGRPVVLLHGNLSTIETDFGRILPSLALNRQVIAVEQQGHGHTADIDRPLSIEQMADDTSALLRHLGVDHADVFGYSSGGGVALEIAIRRPELVRKLVVAGGACYHPDGFYAEIIAGMDGLTPEALAGSPFAEAYARTAPHPEHWPRLIAKIKDLDREFVRWSPKVIQSIAAPTLLMIGDADIVRPEHVVEMFRLRGGGVGGDIAGLPPAQLAVLPGTTHVTLVHRVDWLVSMVEAFLDAPVPEGM